MDKLQAAKELNGFMTSMFNYASTITEFYCENCGETCTGRIKKQADKYRCPICGQITLHEC
jgi:predicted RNA-binding Zn-ribbon protein involved in translation (DUF1610 family)